jgi:hypothetical protein
MGADKGAAALIAAALRQEASNMCAIILVVDGGIGLDLGAKTH